jgi:hypothetical protein
MANIASSHDRKKSWADNFGAFLGEKAGYHQSEVLEGRQYHFERQGETPLQRYSSNCS